MAIRLPLSVVCMLQEKFLRNGNTRERGSHLIARAEEVHAEGQLQDLQQLAEGEVQRL